MSFEEEYLVRSAEYCQLLFHTSELFFKANVDVESHAARRFLHPDVTFSFKSDFHSFATEANKLLDSYSSYSSLHLTSYPEHGALFTEQHERLGELCARATDLAKKIQTLRESELLQEQLWDDDEYTDLFTQCCLSICSANSWQCHLARNMNLSK